MIFGGILGSRSSIESPAVPISSTTILDELGMGGSTTADVSVTEKSSLAMSAVWRAVSLVSGVAASLPFHAYRQVGDARVPTSGMPKDIMEKPHPDLTPMEFWETVYAHILLWGNAYVWVGLDQIGRERWLWPVHPSRVQVGRTSTYGDKVYVIDDGEAVVHGESGRIIHFPGFGYDGICGLSPIRKARNSIGLGLAAEEFGARLFGSGALASGVLQTEQRLTPEQADSLQRRWAAKHSGLKKAHEVIVLDSGASFNQLTIPPDDAQFLESRSFQIDEMSRWFGVPQFLMFQTTKSTSWGTGLEQQALGWVMYDLRRWLTRVEQRMTAFLRPQPTYARYSLEGLLRGDSQERAQFYRSLWEIGAMSTNEIRALEELPPVDGGDTHYRPLNMGLLGEADATATQEVPANA